MLFESSKWILMQMPHTCDTYQLVNNWHTSIKSSKNAGNSRAATTSNTSKTIWNDVLSRITVFNWVIQLESHKRSACFFFHFLHSTDFNCFNPTVDSSINSSKFSFDCYGCLSRIEGISNEISSTFSGDNLNNRNTFVKKTQNDEPQSHF